MDYPRSKLRNRHHRRDVDGDFPSVKNSPLIQARLSDEMYEAWRLQHKQGPRLSKPARSTSRPRVAVIIPTPGPGAYAAVRRYKSVGEDMRTFRPQLGDKACGTSQRKCLQAQAEGTPGPGAYNCSDFAVMGARAQTFAAYARQRGTDQDLEGKVIALHNLRWRIARKREATEKNARTYDKRELEEMRAKAQQLASVIDSSMSLSERPSLGKVTVTRTNESFQRFSPPPSPSPGPGSYAIAPEYSVFGASTRTAASFAAEARTTDSHVPIARSLAAVRLHKHQHAFFKTVVEPGPADYCPPIT